MGKGSTILGGSVKVLGAIMTLQVEKATDKSIVVVSPNVPIKFADIADKPTTLQGYGITDGMSTPLSDILYWDDDEYTLYANKTAVGTNAYLYTGTTNPDGTGRVNLNGYLYATSLYANRFSTPSGNTTGSLYINGATGTTLTLASNANDYLYVEAETVADSIAIEIGNTYRIRFYVDPDDVAFTIYEDTGSDVIFSVNADDELIRIGLDQDIVRGKYTYYRQTPETNTIGDWRMYCTGAGFYIDYLSSITPVTWTTKHTITP